MLLQEEISILSDLSHKTGFKVHSDWLSVSFFVLRTSYLRKPNSSFQVDSDSEVAFVVSEEEAIFKALSKTVDVLEGTTALIVFFMSFSSI